MKMHATLERLEQPVTWVREKVNSLPCNVGRTEQKFRLAAGSVLLATAFAAPLPRGWRTACAILGTMELITGAIRHCPVSRALGINTCRVGDL